MTMAACVKVVQLGLAPSHILADSKYCVSIVASKPPVLGTLLWVTTEVTVTCLQLVSGCCQTPPADCKTADVRQSQNMNALDRVVGSEKGSGVIFLLENARNLNILQKGRNGVAASLSRVIIKLFFEG